MSGVVPLLPVYALMAWSRWTLPFTFTSIIADTLSTLTQGSQGPEGEVTVAVKSREAVTW
jgi:hypothetical protein